MDDHSRGSGRACQASAAGQAEPRTAGLPRHKEWSVGNTQISPGDYTVLIMTGLCALTVAMLAFCRLYIH
jgi:hypothetical protein